MTALTLTTLTPAFLLVGLCIQFCYVSLMETLLQPRFHFRLHRLATAAVLAVLIILPGLRLPSSQRVLLSATVYLLLPFACYQGRWATRLLAFALWLVLFPCAEMISVWMASGLGWSILNISPVQQLLLEGICAFITAMFYLLLRGTMHVIEDRLDRQLWGRLAVTSLSMAGSATVMVLDAYFLQALEISPWLAENLPKISFLAAFLPLIAILGLFSLIHQLNNSIRESEEARFMEAQARAELRQVQAVLDKTAQYRQLRHDIHNHLLTIDALGQKGEYERQHEYLISLNNAFSQTQSRVYCGHPLIDSLLEAKHLRMQEAGIEVEWNMHPAPESLQISDLDLCTLIGNMLDNAIEACERLEADAPRKISISLRIVERTLLFRVANSCKNAGALRRQMDYFSQKRDGPGGLGIKSMRRIVRAHQGELLLQPGEDDGTMLATVYLPGAVQ